MENIIIEDEEIIRFFKNNNFIDPVKFIKESIHGYSENKNKDEMRTKGDVKLSFTEIKELNDEYIHLKTQRDTIIEMTKEFYKELKSKLNNVKMDKLDTITSKHLKINKPVYKCNICDIYSVSTLKGLATHKRKCIKKNSDVISNFDEDELITELIEESEIEH